MTKITETPPPERAGSPPVSSVVTPSGTEIEYFVEPKRKYEVRSTTGDAATMTKWREVPSVTTVLEVLDKPALPWWGMTVGIDSVKTLVEMDLLTVGFDGHKHGLFQPGPSGHLLDQSELVEIVKSHKLTVNHVKSKAGDRGTGVHDALECWGAIGQLPDPIQYPYEQQGYVAGLLAFLTDAEAGGLKSEMIEVVVASNKHGYAGRFDLLATTSDPMRVVTKIYPKVTSKYTVVPGGSRLLIDLKTSKEIYPTHLLQLEAYEGGLQECGYGSTTARAVLHVTADGRYEFRQAGATLEMFLSVLDTYNTMNEVKELMKL